MGRGDSKRARVLGAYDDAAVEIPITLSTTPEQLDGGCDGPFNVVLTAHNPGDRSITFWDLLTPFFGLKHGAFENIECLNSQEKKFIKIYPRNWPHWSWEAEDLERKFMKTIPASGFLSVEHEVPREAITAAGVKPGERYRVQLTFPRQGCKWWTYGTLDDLKGIRLRSYRSLPEFDEMPDGEEDLMEKEWRETYGTGPWTFGEQPGNLCFVGQNVAEFEVAGAVETSISALSLEDQS